MISNLFSKLKDGLTKTRKLLSTDIRDLLKGARIDEELLNRLEEILITADIGVQESVRIIEDLKTDYKKGKLTDSSQIINYLKQELKKSLVNQNDYNQICLAPSGPTVILVVGVNGSGKTTSIAKLAYLQAQRLSWWLG